MAQADEGKSVPTSTPVVSETQALARAGSGLDDAMQSPAKAASPNRSGALDDATQSPGKAVSSKRSAVAGASASADSARLRNYIAKVTINAGAGTTGFNIAESMPSRTYRSLICLHEFHSIELELNRVQLKSEMSQVTQKWKFNKCVVTDLQTMVKAAVGRVTQAITAGKDSKHKENETLSVG